MTLVSVAALLWLWDFLIWSMTWRVLSCIPVLQIVGFELRRNFNSDLALRSDRTANERAGIKPPLIYLSTRYHITYTLKVLISDSAMKITHMQL